MGQKRNTGVRLFFIIHFSKIYNIWLSLKEKVCKTIPELGTCLPDFVVCELQIAFRVLEKSHPYSQTVCVGYIKNLVKSADGKLRGFQWFTHVNNVLFYSYFENLQKVGLQMFRDSTNSKRELRNTISPVHVVHSFWV